MSEQPSIIRFINVAGGSYGPRRADRSAGGLLPTRAFRYCEPLTTASSLGWTIFPPLSFKLIWKNNEILYSFDQGRSWDYLSTANYPGLPARFRVSAPPALRDHYPTALWAFPERGVVQIWSGLLVSTRPGWHCWVRAPVNMPAGRGYDHYEGVVETDNWFGPLFINLQLTRMDTPISIDTEYPLMQVVPIRKDCYTDALLNNARMEDLSQMTDADWQDYARVVQQPQEAESGSPLGRHATEVRRRRRRDIGSPRHPEVPSACARP